MIQKKLNNNSSSIRVYNSILLYVICIISVLTINLVNMGRGSEMLERTEEEEFKQQFKKNYPTIQIIKLVYPESPGANVIQKIANFTNNKTLEQQLYEMDVDMHVSDMRYNKNYTFYDNINISYELLSSFIKNIIHELPEKYINKPIEKQVLEKQMYGIDFIRNWFDHVDKADQPNNYKTTKELIQRLSELIYKSKTMLVLSTYKQIINLSFGDDLSDDTNITSRHYERYSQQQRYYDVHDDYDIHEIDFTFSKNRFNRKYTIVFKPEYGNGPVDSHVKITMVEYHNNSDTIKSSNTKEFLLMDRSGTIFRPLTLRELSTYKVLEELNFGPKTHFVINPYIRNGFYILTEDLSDEKHSFVLARNWKFNHDSIFENVYAGHEDLMSSIQVDVKRIERGEGKIIEKKEEKEERINSLVINLRELQFMSLILNVNIKNSEGIGFLIDKNKISENNSRATLIEQLTQNVLYWKFVNFLVSNDKREDYYYPHIAETNLFTELNNNNLAIEKLSDPLLIRESRDRIYRDKMAMDQLEYRLINYGKRNNLFETERQYYTNLISMLKIEQKATKERLKQEIKEIKLEQEEMEAELKKKTIEFEILNREKSRKMDNIKSDTDLRLKSEVIEYVKNIKNTSAEDSDSEEEGYDKKQAILDYLLEYLLDKKTQDIVSFLKTSRGESEEEKILRHPTETTELNGVVRRRNRTNAELIGFKNGDAPDNVTNPKERLQYLNNVIKDLTVDYVYDIVLDNYFDMPAFIVDEDQEQLDDDDIYYNDIYY